MKVLVIIKINFTLIKIVVFKPQKAYHNIVNNDH